MQIKFYNIDWDTSGEDEVPILPDEVTLDVDEDTNVDNDGADILSDTYGWCVNSFSWVYILMQKTYRAPYVPPVRPRMTEVEYEAKKAEILAELPVEFHGALGWQAWEQGHSSGYEEVILCLSDLVDALIEPIKKYTERIRKSE